MGQITALRMPFTLLTEDEAEHEGIIQLPDMARAERRHGLSITDFEDDKAPPLYFLLTAAYHALRRRGDAPDNYELWLDSVIAFEPDAPDAEGKDENPSEKGAPSTS